MVNIGVDVVDIARFARVVERSPRLVQRVFTEREVEQSGGTTLRASSLAARWAAKEAVAKVLVDNRGLSWHDCEVVAAGRGQPTLQMRGTVLQAGLALGIDSWLLSLSHDGGMAVAFARRSADHDVIDLRSVAQVRAAEKSAPVALADGTLMKRASTGLAIECGRLLAAARGVVVGSRVVLLVGSGGNGGDALWPVPDFPPAAAGSMH